MACRVLLFAGFFGVVGQPGAHHAGSGYRVDAAAATLSLGSLLALVSGDCLVCALTTGADSLCPGMGSAGA
jgi:hypothetical protein